jgi:hypothetical protein
MKLSSNFLWFLGFLTAGKIAESAPTPCVQTGFQLEVLNGSCNFTSLLEEFTPFFEDPVNAGPGCTSSAEVELISLLGQSTRGGAETVLAAVCKEAFAKQNSVPFENIPGYGKEFIREFYNGGTKWNEEYATMFPAKEGGLESNLLMDDAPMVYAFFEGRAKTGMVDWPDYISPNFANCQMNSAYCCWT